MLRYSNIIGDIFYNIGLTKRQGALVDAHFLAAGHHYHRIKLGGGDFHRVQMWRHVKALTEIVRSGDFTDAKDTGGDGYCDLSNPDNWKFSHRLPHPQMFDSTWEDYRFSFGENHPYDDILIHKSIPTIASAEMAA